MIYKFKCTNYRGFIYGVVKAENIEEAKEKALASCRPDIEQKIEIEQIDLNDNDVCFIHWEQ